MSYNVCNYFVDGDRGGNIKIQSSKDAIVKMIKAANPDILVASEVGSDNALDDLMSVLAKAGCDYKYAKSATGIDWTRHLVLISKSPPADFECRNDLTYKIKPKDREDFLAEDVGVQRGFLHAVFKFQNGYDLHIVGAHLKSRVFHNRYNQTDMRRYEARLLKYFINEIQEKEANANILVMGDMNDSYDTDPMLTLRSLEKSPDKRLYDLRPVDSLGIAWTHWWNREDVYGRIDYAYSNLALLPEICFEKTMIPHIAELWMFASDHRPLFITIRTEEMPGLGQDILNVSFKDAIYRKNR